MKNLDDKKTSKKGIDTEKVIEEATVEAENTETSNENDEEKWKRHNVPLLKATEQKNYETVKLNLIDEGSVEAEVSDGQALRFLVNEAVEARLYPQEIENTLPAEPITKKQIAFGAFLLFLLFCTGVGGGFWLSRKFIKKA
jgi:hypothetical protein